jgi:hypothetical protein
MWHIDPLLGIGGETNKETTAIAREQITKYAAVAR